MQKTIGGRLGGLAFVVCILTAAGELVYVLVTGWAPQTPLWGRVISIAFPLLTVFFFGGYIIWHRSHEDSELFFTYAGAFSGASGVVYAIPGIGISIQQYMIGSPILNFDIFVMELWLGGNVTGLVIGHFYALNKAKQICLQNREETLERRRQQLTVLNRVLRHDIRNKTNVILGSVSHLSQADNSAADDAVFIDRIKNNSRKIVEISENARRIESAFHDSRTSFQRLDVVAVVEQIVMQVESRFPDAEITTELPAEASIITNGYIDAAVENVLQNAIEHNDAETPKVTVTVSVAQNCNEVRIRIADNGPGIPASERDVFKQEQETKLQHSNGLGLWLVHWIIRDVNGDVSIEDRQPRGTAVTLSIPQTAPDIDVAAQ